MGWDQEYTLQAGDVTAVHMAAAHEEQIQRIVLLGIQAGKGGLPVPQQPRQAAQQQHRQHKEAEPPQQMLFCFACYHARLPFLRTGNR